MDYYFGRIGPIELALIKGLFSGGVQQFGVFLGSPKMCHNIEYIENNLYYLVIMNKELIVVLYPLILYIMPFSNENKYVQKLRGLCFNRVIT